MAKKTSNTEKLDKFYKSELRRRWLLFFSVVTPVLFVFYLLSAPMGRATEVVATATKAKFSYRNKSNHKQQVALDDGQLLMVTLPHEVTLLPGDKVLLSMQSLTTFGLKHYQFMAKLNSTP